MRFFNTTGPVVAAKGWSTAEVGSNGNTGWDECAPTCWWSGPEPAPDPQCIVIECKVRHGSLEGTIDSGLKQTRAYMDHCTAEERHLIDFDRSSRPWRDKVFRREETEAGGTVTNWGM